MSKEMQEAIEEALEVAEGRGGDSAFTGAAQVEIAGKEVGSSGFAGFPTDGLVRLAQILRPLGSSADRSAAHGGEVLRQVDILSL